ncbi:MAG: FkbM family methyltransferase [Cyanobacteriota bacterium]|nr:FkbM family methyltransferase [Cyanobacteriota bacterium]
MKVKRYLKQKLAKALDLVSLQEKLERLEKELLPKLAKAIDLAALKEKLERLEGKLLPLNKEFERLKAEVEQLKLKWKQSNKDNLNLWGMQYWYEGNFWEPTVQIALRDLCQPGTVVFDVGANLGGLATLMSRLVGPKGVVCAFEASPRIVDKCQRNLNLNGCHNAHLYHVAVFRTSHKKIPIYAGSHLNDSIYADSCETQAPTFQVSTLKLDDFVEFTGLVPDLVKMDIEGAEYDAVMGMLQTLDRAKPHLILEQQPQDSRCLDALRDRGYLAIDLNSYREIRSAEDYPPGVRVRNTLFIHRDRLSETPYQPPFKFVEAATLDGSDFQILETGSVAQKLPLHLDKGRYFIDVEMKAEGVENEMMCGVKVNQEVAFRYHTYTHFLASSYRDWILNLTDSSPIELYFGFLKQTYDETFVVKGAKIYRIQEFDRVKPWLYF